MTNNQELRNIFNLCGLNRRELADNLKIDRKTLYRWLNDEAQITDSKLLFVKSVLAPEVKKAPVPNLFDVLSADELVSLHSILVKVSKLMLQQIDNKVGQK